MTETEDSLDLYRHTVLDHSREPRNRARPVDTDRAATGHNPLCGDKVQVYLHIVDQEIRDIGFEATGCAICMASASMMTEAVKGVVEKAARLEIRNFLAAMRAEDSTSLTGDLAALGSVRDYPSRVRCATLPWQTLEAALDAAPQIVTTE